MYAPIYIIRCNLLNRMIMKKAKRLFTLAIILMVALFAKADENWETLNNKMPAQIIALKLLAYGYAPDGKMVNTNEPSKANGNENEFFFLSFYNDGTAWLTQKGTKQGDKEWDCTVNGTKLQAENGWWIKLVEIRETSFAPCIVTIDKNNIMRIFSAHAMTL